MVIVTACIVLYKNDKKDIVNAIKSILSINLNIRLYLIDNSPIDSLKNISNDYRVVYIHNPSNPGFGASHNIAINLALESGSKYHFIINPDIHFNGDVILKMIEYMKTHKEVGMIMPEILNEDGTIQYLPKLLPNPFWLLRRKLKKPVSLYKRFISIYELRNLPEKYIYNAPILSGCFTLLNLDAIKVVGAYDERFFMYFEDFDLSRRVHQKYKTIYYPEVSVYHGYEGGANKNVKLFKIFVSSAVAYFNKWGWFFDAERKKINKRALEQL